MNISKRGKMTKAFGGAMFCVLWDCSPALLGQRLCLPDSELYSF